MVPQQAAALHQAFEALVQAYFHEASFEPRADLEARCAQLLPALMLARMDGKSPVEYITNEADRERVRAVAVPLIAQPMTSLAEISCSWSGFLPV